MIARLSKIKVFTKLNIRFIFNYIYIYFNFKKLTIFYIKYNYFKLKVLLFKLTNSLAIF
jgi:hypothetical protein